MKKMISRLLSLFLCICLVSFQFSFAAVSNYGPLNTIEPRVEITCPGGIHDMLSSGTSRVFETSTGNSYVGRCYQCQYCYLVLASQRDPVYQSSLGWYYLGMLYEPVGTVGIVIETDTLDTFNGSIHQDVFWQGFSFRKNTVNT